MQFTVKFVGATSESILHCSDCLRVTGVHGHAFVHFVQNLQTFQLGKEHGDVAVAFG
jgi:hypothetical protein